MNNCGEGDTGQPITPMSPPLVLESDCFIVSPFPFLLLVMDILDKPVTL